MSYFHRESSHIAGPSSVGAANLYLQVDLLKQNFFVLEDFTFTAG